MAAARNPTPSYAPTRTATPHHTPQRGPKPPKRIPPKTQPLTRKFAKRGNLSRETMWWGWVVPALWSGVLVDLGLRQYEGSTTPHAPVQGDALTDGWVRRACEQLANRARIACYLPAWLQHRISPRHYLKPSVPRPLACVRVPAARAHVKASPVKPPNLGVCGRGRVVLIRRGLGACLGGCRLGGGWIAAVGP